MSLKKIYNELKTDEEVDNMFGVLDKLMVELKAAHPEKYNSVKEELYIVQNGYHFDEDLLHKAYDHMINDDGTNAPKWDLSQTTSVANSLGFKFNKYNQYDFNYVMNMMYSDYAEIWGDNYNTYGKMTIKFLNDKDAPEGKALRYYMAMH